jgi:hypothetical protein
MVSFAKVPLLLNGVLDAEKGKTLQGPGRQLGFPCGIATGKQRPRTEVGQTT